MRKQCLLLFGIVLLLGSCKTECDYTEAELTVRESQSQTDILSITGPICQEGASTVIEDPDYYILSVVHEGAMSQERDPMEAFELGRQITSPMAGINTASRHIFDVRNRTTFWNNLNDPYLPETESSGSGTLLSFTGEVTLTGHPLYAILALLNIDDKGGSKTWKIFRMTELDGSSIEDLTHWQCYLDNLYTFMKGYRFKYDPNGFGDDGLICDDESSFFTNPSAVTHAYGTYTVEHGGNELLVKTQIRTSLNESYEMIFNVRSYDWEELQITLRNSAGEEAIAVMTPYEYSDTF